MNLQIVFKRFSLLKRYFPIIIVILAILSLVYGRLHPTIQLVNVKVPVIKEVEVLKKIYVPVVQIRVIEKERVVEVLKLPEWVSNDSEIQVLTAGKVVPYVGHTQVTSLINTQTGEGSLIETQLLLSPFAFENVLSVGVGYGLRGWEENYSFRTEWEFMRIGKLRIELFGEVNTRPEGVIGIMGKVELFSTRR